VVNMFQMNGVSVPDGVTVGSMDWAKYVGNALLQLDHDTDTSGNYQTVGSIYGFEVLMRTDIVGTNHTDAGDIAVKANKYFVKGSRIMYRLTNNTIDHRSASTAVNYPLQVLQVKLTEDLQQWTERLAMLRRSLEQLKSIANEEWGKDDELKQLKADLSALDKRIKSQLDSEEGKQTVTTDEQLPVRFEKCGRYHKAIFDRKTFSLVTADEMRKVIDKLPGYGYLSDTEWSNGQRVPRDEWEVEFYSCKSCADFIETISKMQREREGVKEAA